MKNHDWTAKLPFRLMSAAFLAAAITLTASAAAPAIQGRLDIRPLTPQDIKQYALTNLQGASGMSAVGLGQPVYLDALVNVALPSSNIVSVTWSLTTKPVGSSAAIANSPLGTNVPIYKPSDQIVSKIADRAMLRPDLAGQYVVTATITTTDSGSTNVSQKITGGTYVGAQTCALCHSGGVVAENQYEPWLQTAHATFFTRAIDGQVSDHYGNNCISCHTVGYDKATNAVNGGFDDIATQLGWTFPSQLTNGNWLALPSTLKALANIQCESCHGPGSEHSFALGNTNVSNWPRLGMTLSAGDCAQCHDSKPQHVRNAEWANSRHAVTTRSPSGPGREGCVGCHTAKGFIGRMDGATTLSTEYEAITCAACHDPHDAANPHQLRSVAAVTLNDNITTITNAGNAALCMQCHKSRRDAVVYVETTSGSGNFGPHENPQSDMLAGANAVTYGKEIPSSAHRDVVSGSCLACHAQSVASTDPAFGKVGGHTFSLHWDGGTTNTTSDDVELTGACVQCHGPMESFDFARQDYDGDGTVEGVQTEVRGLMDQLAFHLPPVGVPKSTISINSSWTRPQLRAGYNYKFVQYDGSLGAHNLAYAVGILKASIADLTDDADHDGLSDKWEQEKFGNITSFNGHDDNDGDGVNNALELAAGTNPLLTDSDGDGFSDWAELQAGSDPTNNADQPGLVVSMVHAGEVLFASQVGKTYQIQRISELSSSWQQVGTNVPGTGGIISHLVSTRTGGQQAFYRVVQLP